MGKIKNFVTGLFSKKDNKDEEILQIQPASDPDRELSEYENRYETPDYQAFLNEMGYIDRNQIRNSDTCPEDHVEESHDIDPDEVLEEGSYEECIFDTTSEINPEDVAKESASTYSACELNENTLYSETTAEDTLYAEMPEDSMQPMSEAEEQSPCEVDQEFIDEGVAELGVNDVWPEEED